MTRQVVYVDDELVLCRVFRSIFESEGIAIETFSDAHEAITYINHHPVAVVICDYRMPTMNGLELLDQLERQVPFFLVSGDLDVVDRSGANPRITRVLSKPFRPEELLGLVRGLVAEPDGSP